MTVVLLARHGETDWNAEGRFQGHADVPLNERGREQARALGRLLDDVPLGAVYCSDLLRARETAEIVADGRSIPVVPLAELREVDVGEWSGLTGEEIEARWPGAMQSWRDEGCGWRDGESYDALGARVIGCLQRLVATHDGERILYVGHGAAIRTVLARTLGITYVEYRRSHPSIGNGVLYRIAIEDGRLLRHLD